MEAFAYWTIITLAFVVVLIAFGIYEFIAINTGKRENTYTVWIRYQLGIEPPREHRLWASGIFAFILIIFTTWFVPHIVLGWWGGAPL